MILSIRLTYSSLWLDETVEYFASKTWLGANPVFYNDTNMYERIVYTFQPPLYNILMHFWLILFDTEVGFRMAGVFTTVIGAMGIYFLFRDLDRKYACIATIVYSSIYGIAFYAQECAEYNLMLCFIVWTIFFYIKSCSASTWKNIICFCLCAIGAVYSQYGAAFVVAGTFICLLINYCRKKDKKGIARMIISGGLAGIFFGVPLIYFFMLKQLKKANSEKVSTVLTSATEIIKEIITGTRSNFITYFIRHDMQSAMIENIVICTGVLFGIVAVLVALFYYKDTKTKFLCEALVISYAIYLIACEAGVYGTGYTRGYGRWSLQFLPVLVICMLIGIYSLLEKQTKQMVRMGALLVAFTFIIINIYTIYQNWNKGDARESTMALLSELENEKPSTCIVIERHGCSNNFLYYWNKYGEQYKDDITIFFCEFNDTSLPSWNEKVEKIDLEDTISKYDQVYWIYTREDKIEERRRCLGGKNVTFQNVYSEETVIDKSVM